MAESGGGIGETVSERYVDGRFVELELGASDCVSIAEGESVLCHTYSDHHAYPPGPALSGILQRGGRWIPLDCGRRVFLADGSEDRNAFVPGMTSKGDGREIRCVEGSGEHKVTKFFDLEGHELRREPTPRP